MTAVVSAINDNYTTVSAVFLTQGICVDKGLGRLEVKTGPGWMTATRFITNRRLADSLDEAWKHESRKIKDSTKMELFAGQRQFGYIDGESLENKKFDHLRTPDPEISDMSVDSANAIFTFAFDKFSLRTKESRFMGSKGPQMYQQIPHFQVKLLQYIKLGWYSVTFSAQANNCFPHSSRVCVMDFKTPPKMER